MARNVTMTGGDNIEDLDDLNTSMATVDGGNYVLQYNTTTGKYDLTDANLMYQIIGDYAFSNHTHDLVDIHNLDSSPAMANSTLDYTFGMTRIDDSLGGGYILERVLPYDNVSTFGLTLLDDTSGGGMLTTLGVSTYAQTLLDDTSGGAIQTTLGISTFAQTLLDDTSAGAFETTLGISSFMQTVLDDTVAGDARTTLGAQASATAIIQGKKDYNIPIGSLAGYGVGVGGITITTMPNGDQVSRRSNPQAVDTGFSYPWEPPKSWDGGEITLTIDFYCVTAGTTNVSYSAGANSVAVGATMNNALPALTANVYTLTNVAYELGQCVITFTPEDTPTPAKLINIVFQRNGSTDTTTLQAALLIAAKLTCNLTSGNDA